MNYSTVLAIPNIVEPPMSTIQEKGSTVTFTCTVAGNGTLNIIWTLPSQQIVFAEPDIVNSWTVTSSLTVVNIIAEDGGFYYCFTTNEAGSNHASAVLSVSLYVSGPLFDLYTANGTYLIITCMIEGYPISYTWEKMNNINNTEISTERDLVFNPVSFGDEGVYRCVAHSDMVDILSSDNITVTSE